MIIEIKFNTNKKIEDGDRFHACPTLDDSEMEEVKKLAKKLKVNTDSLILVINRLVYMTFNNVIGKNEKLGFKELIDMVEQQVEWEREQEKKNGQSND